MHFHQFLFSFLLLFYVYPHSFPFLISSQIALLEKVAWTIISNRRSADSKCHSYFELTKPPFFENKEGMLWLYCNSPEHHGLFNRNTSYNWHGVVSHTLPFQACLTSPKCQDWIFEKGLACKQEAVEDIIDRVWHLFMSKMSNYTTITEAILKLRFILHTTVFS